MAPCYSAASIVNAASFLENWLAPNTLVAIFGSNLSYVTRAVSQEDVLGGRLPVQLGGVTVQFGPRLAPLYYVSPNQINVLVPANLLPGPHSVQIAHDGWAGPAVMVELSDVAPALFQMDRATAVASHEDFSVVTPDSPARPGHFVTLWANGLGPVTPPLSNYALIPSEAAWITRLVEFKVMFDGVPISDDRITYVGVAPCLAGVYQINVKLPDTVGQDPEVRISLGGKSSVPGIHIPVRSEN